MKEDIVTRLQDKNSYEDCLCRRYGFVTLHSGYECLCYEAAGEIESLRKTIRRLHREMDMELFGESEYKDE